MAGPEIAGRRTQPEVCRGTYGRNVSVAWLGGPIGSGRLNAEMLHVHVGGAAVVDDQSSRKRDEKARTTGRHRPLRERGIAVIGPVGLGPADKRRDRIRVEGRLHHPCLLRRIEGEAVAVGVIEGLDVAAIVDRIALEAGHYQRSDDLARTHASRG